MKKIKSVGAALLALMLLMSAACAGNGGKGGASGGGSKAVSSGASGAESAGIASSGASGAAESGGASQAASGQNSTAKSSSKAQTGSVSVPAKTVTLKFASQWPSSYNQPAGKSEISDLYTKKFKEIKTKFNVEIKVEEIDKTTVDIVARAIAAGDSPYDLIEMQMAYIRSLARGGALYDQKTIGTLNLNASQFVKTKAVQDNLTFNNKVYASTFGFPDVAIMGVYANTSLLSRYGLDNVQTLYKNNKWTWTNFERLAKSATRNTGTSAETWGIGCDQHLVGMSLTAAAGGTVTRSGSTYTVAMASPKGVDAMIWVRKLFITEKCYNYYAAGLATGYPDFAAGKLAFYPTYLSHVSSFASTMTDDFTFLPFPKETEQSNYVNGVYDAKMFAVPKTVKNAKLVGAVYQELSTLASQIDKVYENRYRDFGLDENGIKAAMEMPKYLKPEYVGGVDTSSIDKKMTDSVFSGNGNPATTMASVKSQFQKLVDDYYAKFK